MKILPFVLITICVISMISEIDCHHHHHHHQHHHHHYFDDYDDKCLHFNKKCSHDSDCCSGNCAFSLLWLHKYCRESELLWFAVRTSVELLFHKDKTEICTYNETTYSNDTISKGYDKFEINAHHLKYPANITVIVERDNKFVEVKVNNVGITYNNSTIELSKRAAEILNIKHGENVPCQIKIPRINSILLRHFFKYLCPYIIVYLVYSLS